MRPDQYNGLPASWPLSQMEEVVVTLAEFKVFGQNLFSHYYVKAFHKRKDPLKQTSKLQWLSIVTY